MSICSIISGIVIIILSLFILVKTSIFNFITKAKDNGFCFTIQGRWVILVEDICQNELFEIAIEPSLHTSPPVPSLGLFLLMNRRWGLIWK
jgi:hypothetical protein